MLYFTQEQILHELYISIPGRESDPSERGGPRVAGLG